MNTEYITKTNDYGVSIQKRSNKTHCWVFYQDIRLFFRSVEHVEESLGEVSKITPSKIIKFTESL